MQLGSPFLRFLNREEDDPRLPLAALERVARRLGIADELLIRERYREAKEVLVSIDLSVLPIAARDAVIKKHAYAAARST